MSIHSRGQRGASLIEVLIAVLVLAVGLLGVAAMQARALKNSQSSFERTQATILSYSLIDAMRADVVNARAGTYVTGGWMCAIPAGGTLAQNQIRDWMTAMRSPNGGLGSNACGRVSACNAVGCTVEVRWDDSLAAGGNSSQVVTSVTRL